MDDLSPLFSRIALIEHGFKPLEAEAETLLAERSDEERFDLAHRLFASDVVQARMLSVLICERIIGDVDGALPFLRDRVSIDPSWKVQEMLARVFDALCRIHGYEASRPLIRQWLASDNPNIRRAVTEGLRIWTSRPWFRDHPEEAIALLSSKRDDPVAYVRTSAGNAIRDISRAHPELVRVELKTWDLSNRATAFTHKLAARFVS
ncbi:MAG: DNA alkylation repair protein [Thermomicrobiales bacterium]